MMLALDHRPGITSTRQRSHRKPVSQIVRQFTGLVRDRLRLHVIYSTLIAPSRRRLQRDLTRSSAYGRWIFFVYRFAQRLMFPLGGGFSAGQQMVLQGAMWGIGMARSSL